MVIAKLGLQSLEMDNYAVQTMTLICKSGGKNSISFPADIELKLGH